MSILDELQRARDDGFNAVGQFLELVRGQRLTVNYEAYIQSPQWRAKADACKERDGWQCRLCENTHDLHAHHRTYKRLGNERPEDLTTLCGRCHALFHGRLAR